MRLEPALNTLKPAKRSAMMHSQDSALVLGLRRDQATCASAKDFAGREIWLDASDLVSRGGQ